MDLEQDKERLIKMLDGVIYLNWFEGGGAEIHRIWDSYVLFDVPQFGGTPRYEGTYQIDELDKLLTLIYTWN